jgi:hypothetical protein
MPPDPPVARFEPEWNSPIPTKTRFFNILGGRLRCDALIGSFPPDLSRISLAILRTGREVLMISAGQCSITA